MKTATKILTLSTVFLALSGCVIHVKAQKADVELEENLSVTASQVTHFNIEAGAGSLNIVGSDTATSIDVKADIQTTEEKNYTLYLNRSGNKAKLVAKHESTSGYWKGSSPQINLTVTMPKNIALDIDDGSGDIMVSGINSSVNLDDGSGSASLENIKGDVNVEDGSGELLVKNITGNLIVDDGSGELTISNISGNVDVEDGSGELNVYKVGGKVVIDDGSGSINVEQAGGLKIIESGSGGLSISKIKGEVDIDS